MSLEIFLHPLYTPLEVPLILVNPPKQGFHAKSALIGARLPCEPSRDGPDGHGGRAGKF